MKGFLLRIIPVVLVAEGVFCSMVDATCAGTLYFKPPPAACPGGGDWSSAYVYITQTVTEMTQKDGEYFVIDLANASQQAWSNPSITVVSNPVSPSCYVNTTSWNFYAQYSPLPYSDGILCPGAGNKVYVLENPLQPGTTYTGPNPPDAKYFYVKVPQNADWIWSVPMIREQGSATGKAMTPVSGRCGWYQAVWDQASVPTSAEIYNAQGYVLGEGALPLSSLLSDARPKLYYDADAGLLDFTDPGTNGSCALLQGSRFYFLLPEDKDWQSATPMLSTDGGVTGVAMRPAQNMCGWFYAEWSRGETPPENVVIFRSTDRKREDMIGINGLWGDADGIPLKQKFIELGSNLYFVPDDGAWETDALAIELGWSSTDPLIDGICSFNLAAVIYDTDESLNPLFTTDGISSGFGACTGVRHGIVKQNLGANNKPVFNSGNSNAILCAGDEKKFNTLFNYTKGVNEVQCYDMPFRHYGTDPRWGFDSDSAASLFGGYSGFHPVENTTDATVVSSISPQACPTCRTKRRSQGPVPVVAAQAANFDKYCNTYGWSGGVECEGLFKDGDTPAVWDWGASRWENKAGHNQQFCFESHATFTYQEDQEFTFRGDDDIWVFINKKLALDNGGAHLAAPGHVVLKNLNNTYGSGFLQPGREYPLDIFFCDRRTTMSNVIIKTNMFIRQSSGLSISPKENADGSVGYEVCYDRSGDGSCAAVALGSAAGGSASIHACGADISSKVGMKLKFAITTRAGELVDTLSPGQSGWQYGGIDLSKPFSPKVDKDRITGLPSGSYRLVMDICDASGTCDVKARTYINFRINGNLDVMTKTSTYVVNAGDEKSEFYKNGTKWTYRGTGLAGGRVPVYVSAFANGGVDLLSAVGQSYNLLLSSGLKAYASQTGFTKVSFPKTINASGIDTIWIYMDPEEMTTSPMKRRVSLKSTASIDFYATEKENLVSDRALNKPVFKLSVVRRNLYVSGVKVGGSYQVFDIQGKLVKRGLFASSGAVVQLPHAGTYLVRVDGTIRRVQVK